MIFFDDTTIALWTACYIGLGTYFISKETKLKYDQSGMPMIILAIFEWLAMSIIAIKTGNGFSLNNLFIPIADFLAQFGKLELYLIGLIKHAIIIAILVPILKGKVTPQLSSQQFIKIAVGAFAIINIVSLIFIPA